MALSICGDDAIFMPEEKCDSCEQFESEIQRLDRAVEALDANKSPRLTAGEGIIITDENVISAVMNASNTYTKEQVDALIGDVDHVEMEIVDALPTVGESHIIYLLPKTGGGFEMWIYTASGIWADIGGTSIDLTEYYTSTQVDNLLAGKQDKLTFDNVPTDGSNNPVKSDGVYDRFTKSDANLAPIETNPASATHAVGDWVVYNGSLYRVTAAIAQGDALTVEGNIALDTALGVASYTGSVPTYGGTVAVVKSGAVAQIRVTNVGAVSPIPASTPATLMELPRAFWPRLAVSVYGNVDGRGDGSNSVRFSVAENGELYVYTYSQMVSGGFSATYITL